jgi:hydrogenase maturation protease
MTPASPAPPISCACTLTGAERGAALRVIGLGSPHDADQLGWLLAEALSAALAGRSDISVHVCRDPARELLGLLLGAQAALLVDALAQAGEPGRLHELGLEDLAARHAACSSHALDLREQLELAQVLEILPPELRLLGVAVEPGSGVAGARRIVDDPGTCAGVCRVLDEMLARIQPEPGD